MIKNGFLFNDECWTDEKFESEVLKHKNKTQDNFDILFDKKRLITEIQVVFNKMVMKLIKT